MAARVILFADPQMGVVSFSWRLRTCLEKDGAAVLWFTPASHPWLFKNGCVKIKNCSAFLSRFSVSSIVFCDGLYCDERPHCSTPVFQTVFRSDGKSVLQRLWGESGSSDISFHLTPDPGVLDFVLANDRIGPTGLLVIGDCTSEAREIAGKAIQSGESVLAIGERWGSDLSIPPTLGGVYYALRQARRAVLVSREPSARDIYVSQLYFLLSGNEVTPASGICQVLQGGSAYLSERSFYTDELRSALLGDDEFSGCSNSGKLVVLLGYVGKGNFGDEFIMSQVASSFVSDADNTTMVAVSEDPEHTFCVRGIYPLSLTDKNELDHYLSRACLALVVAGLLFDQGVRWTCGKNELFSCVIHSDLPGITAFNSLAFMNNIPTIYYGIGAGPLKLEEGHAMLRVCSKLNSRFFARDAKTEELLTAAGVDCSLIETYADSAFACPSLSDEPAPEAVVEMFRGALIGDYCFVSLREYENVPGDFAERAALALDEYLQIDESRSVVIGLLDASDRNISSRVLHFMERGDRCFIYDNSDDIRTLQWLIEHAQCGLAMRYHCALLMSRAGKPCVGLGYLPKVHALYEQLGVADKFLLPMEADAASIVSALQAVSRISGDYPLLVGPAISQLVDRANAAWGNLVKVVRDGRSINESSRRHDEVYYFEQSGTDRYISELQGLISAQVEGLAESESRLNEAKADFEELNASFEKARVTLDLRISELSGERDSLSARVQELECSTTWKVGKFVMLLPCLAKKAVMNLLRRHR